MDDEAMTTDPRNFNQRVESIEQILPTLATRQDLREQIALLATEEELHAAIAQLATKEDLRAAIAPLATREEMRPQGDELRRHMDVIGESLRSDIRLLAEHLASVMPRGNRS